uniref:Putative voltage-dependent L-type calcium channel n=1 Tax=Cladonia uncialis subsp. uncialis TaxID=180999 RepID=A0A1Z1C499_CLAUC|nr:putative voltage-dependent L-type calcium channel [Cladonia uncialis subsp. uncialis]AUW31100.1 putative voltage-dependent L-type calcium channel [Cladonia uncialis subsp. uncialis]
MAGTEKTPRQLRQDFGGVEMIYRKMSTAFGHVGKEHWGIHCVCHFRLGQSFGKRDTGAALREAWKALMFEYPGLSVVPDGLTKVFIIPDAQTAEKWVDQTFFVESTENAETIIANSTIKDLPSLFYLSSSSEIVFLSQHWRIDAIGTCMLLDRLFSIMAQPQDPASLLGKPVLEEISPCLEDAAGSPQNIAPELQDFAREYIDNFHKRAVNSGGLPFKGDAATLPAESSHQDLILTTDSTIALVAECKNRRISVSAAIHASLAYTVFSFAPPEDQPTDYTTVMATNMREHLPPPYNSKTHACQTYVASIIPTVPRSSDFSAATAALTRKYKIWHSQKFMQALREIYKYHAEKLFAPRPEGLPPPKPPSGVTLSSLGVIEKYLTGDYGDAVQVDRFRFGVGMMTRQMLLYAWTFRGQLNLSVNYNAAYYDNSMAQEVLSRIKSTLEKELGLELNAVVP